MKSDTLVVETGDGRALELSKYIQSLKSKTEQGPKGCKLKICEADDDYKTPAERLAYNKRLEKLKAKIAQIEYEEMTKNLKPRGNFLSSFSKELKDASSLAYGHIGMAISALVSVLSFYFIPILTLPDTIPFGAKIIAGCISATIILCIEIYYFAKSSSKKLKSD